MIVFLGTSIWLYIQNNNLKSKNDSLRSTQDQTDKKMAAASKKIEVLSIFFAGEMSQEKSLQAYDLIKSMNDKTLTDDWTAMQNSTPGDSTGNKMMQDLIAATENDLK